MVLLQKISYLTGEVSLKNRTPSSPMRDSIFNTILSPHYVCLDISESQPSRKKATAEFAENPEAFHSQLFMNTIKVLRYF